jgi:hypothetical protein
MARRFCHSGTRVASRNFVLMSRLHVATVLLITMALHAGLQSVCWQNCGQSREDHHLTAGEHCLVARTTAVPPGTNVPTNGNECEHIHDACVSARIATVALAVSGSPCEVLLDLSSHTDAGLVFAALPLIRSNGPPGRPLPLVHLRI